MVGDKCPICKKPIEYDCEAVTYTSALHVEDMDHLGRMIHYECAKTAGYPVPRLKKEAHGV